jgi:hypothetical protein
VAGCGGGGELKEEAAMSRRGKSGAKWKGGPEPGTTALAPRAHSHVETRRRKWGEGTALGPRMRPTGKFAPTASLSGSFIVPGRRLA